MRSTIKYVFIALAMMFAGTVSAKANAHWICIGASYVCGSKSASTSNRGYTSRKHRSAKKYRYSRRAKYSSNRRYRSAAKRRSYKKRSYSSGRSHSSGLASYYWQPQRVASGGWFNPNALTAAHKTLPFGTRVRVTNKHNGRSIVVTINDRGPFVRGRIIDLSKRAAQAISMTGAGVVPVSVAVVGRG